MPTDELQARIGLATGQGRRDENEDYAAAYLGTQRERLAHGMVMAVADGIGGAPGGREAAEIAVRQFIDGYYAQAEGVPVEEAAGRAFRAINSWIHAVGQRDPELFGMGTTLSALILRGREAHVAHVGDSRVSRLRAEKLRRLTTDHNLHELGLSHILLRSIGAEERVEVDFAVHELELGDRFLLSTDGVHDTLSDFRIRELLAEEQDPDAAARSLVAAALEAGSYDNVTALVVDVTGLPSPD